VEGAPPATAAAAGSRSTTLEEALPAHIPSLEEFTALFMADCIPAEYLEEKWIWFEGNKAWLNGRGELKDFRVLVRGWWKKDRAAWKPAAAESNRAANVTELEALLKTEKNPAERDKLRARLKGLEAKP
jgi:hypothetical protein